MSRKLEMFFAAAAILCMVCGCAATAGQTGKTLHDAGRDHAVEVLRPSGIHEDCMEVAPGQVLTYSYEASVPLSFNIHYHDNGEVVYAVKKDSASTDSGSMTPQKKHHYCLMWTNTHKDLAKITYSYRVEERR